jgi:hypothetical protein
MAWLRRLLRLGRQPLGSDPAVVRPPTCPTTRRRVWSGKLAETSGAESARHYMRLLHDRLPLRVTINVFIPSDFPSHRIGKGHIPVHYRRNVEWLSRCKLRDWIAIRKGK